ncbi:MAG: transketolase family protein [Acidobacteria bacterium]|nr:MAG: transketolase family protein [Acidobacteriota bacterium]
MAELESMRIAYGRALVQLGRENRDVVVLSADVANSDHSSMFADEFPDRFYNVGIAEQALVDVAAGLAYAGKIPFANTFAFLFATRALEMVRTHLCYGGANVKLMGAYAGLSDSFDGPTHHSITDVAIMRSLPNLTVVIPSDPVCLSVLLPQVAASPGPVFFRLNRNEVPVLFKDKKYAPEIGKGVVLREGRDVALIGAGLMVSRCLQAAEILQDQHGLNATVAEFHTVKPLDEVLVLELASQNGAIVTAEEHSVIGGLGGAVCEAVSARYPVPVERVGIADCFAESGPYAALLKAYRLEAEDIAEAALRAICGRTRSRKTGTHQGSQTT